MRFKIVRASHIVGSKFTVFSLFYFVFEGNFPSTSPRGAYNWRGDLTERFCVTRLGGLYLEGLIHGGAYFRNFTVSIGCFGLLYFTTCLFESRYGLAKIQTTNNDTSRYYKPEHLTNFTRALVFVTLVLVSAAQPFFGSSRNGPPHWSVA